MRRHQDVFAFFQFRQDVLVEVRRHARDDILQAFAAGGRHIVGAAPDVHLLLAEFLAGLVLVEAGQVAVVALTQVVVFHGWRVLPHLAQRQRRRGIGALEGRGINLVEFDVFQGFAGGLGLGDARLVQVDVGEAGKAVFVVPLALPVAEEDKIVHDSLLSLTESSILPLTFPRQRGILVFQRKIFCYMKNKQRKIAALIMAAGAGERFGGATPKQYLPLMGQAVLRRSLAAFQDHPLISDVTVVIHADHVDYFKALVPDVEFVAGGADRQSSVRAGLEHLRGKNPDVVLIHDAARPLVTARLITEICKAAIETGAAIPGLPVTDSVKRHGKMESRDGLYTVQTPQGFSFALIDSLHQKYKGKSFTDDAALCEAEGCEVTIVPGLRDNIKITHAGDIELAEQYLQARLGDIRTGQGYDVHCLVAPTAGRKMMICGVEVPHDKVLEGHSDADVGLHAITDAVLGAIGGGDIGQHFSPKDARWKNADSAAFLKYAAEMVAKRGGVIAHADVTIICEEPKISPHRDAMRHRIAVILSLSPDRVSVKATTTEGLGFTGRGEGIAAQSVVTVRLPFRSDDEISQ